jgi:hypothetical protein
VGPSSNRVRFAIWKVGRSNRSTTLVGTSLSLVRETETFFIFCRRNDTTEKRRCPMLTQAASVLNLLLNAPSRKAATLRAASVSRDEWI